MDIRDAVAADAPELARIHIRAWQVGYAGLMPADYLAGQDLAERRLEWERGLARPRADSPVLVADDGAGPVGFAIVGAAQGSAEPDLGELYALNVDPDLTAFAKIRPCGFSPAVMTSLAQELGRPVRLAEVRPFVIDAWTSRFAPPSATENPSMARGVVRSPV